MPKTENLTPVTAENTTPVETADIAPLEAENTALAKMADVAPAEPPDTAQAKPAASPHAASDAVLSTAEISRLWEASVALIKGKASSGTGFLVKPGLVATNAHVLKSEFFSSFEVRFASAPAGRQGPLTPTVLYADTDRDLAFLAVRSELPPIELVPVYQFVRGEDLMAIGNPGFGDDRVLETPSARA